GWWGLPPPFCPARLAGRYRLYDRYWSLCPAGAVGACATAAERGIWCMSPVPCGRLRLVRRTRSGSRCAAGAVAWIGSHQGATSPPVCSWFESIRVRSSPFSGGPGSGGTLGCITPARGHAEGPRTIWHGGFGPCRATRFPPRLLGGSARYACVRGQLVVG